VALTITPLHLGTMPNFSKAAITYGRNHAELVDVAIIMFAIRGGDHTVIVDTGTGSPDDVRAKHGFTLVRPPEQEPLAALERAGIDPADVGTVVHTHLHWDHCSNNHLFPNARFVVQQSELQYAVDPMPPNRATYERRPGMVPVWMPSIGSIETVSGDVPLLPGISLVHLPGHSPGSQGVVVEAAGGRYLVAGDCITYHDNWTGDERLAHIPTGGLTSMYDFMDSFEKIERLDCQVIPSHDPRVLDVEVFA